MMKSQITREAAWELLRKYNKDSFHLQHALTKARKDLYLMDE